jgi:predicted transposase YdaD
MSHTADLYDGYRIRNVPFSSFRVIRIRAADPALPNDESTRKNLIGCTEVLAGIKFEKSLIRSIFREDIMKESVIYQDILQQGHQKGRQEGESFMLLRFLRRQLGELSPAIETQINAIPQSQLEVLADRLHEFSQLSDLTDWLAQNA